MRRGKQGGIHSLVMGAGSMGTMLGACLSRARFWVDLIDVNRQHVDALNSRGAYDLVFLLTKQTHNEAAFAQLKPHLHEGSIVCTFQNGIPEPAVAAAFGADQTLGCAITWAATYLGPGRVQSTSAPEKWHTALGTFDGTISSGAKGVRAILSTMCQTELTTNLAGIRWSKLLVNASFSGMSTVLRLPNSRRAWTSVYRWISNPKRSD